MINLYDKNEKEFITNGLVVLNNCKSCFITEENNGSYELEAECILDSRGKWQYLIEGNVIKADGQLFRIYHKVKTLVDIKVNARHIFYDLLDNLVEEIDIRALQGAQALDRIMTNTAVSHSFKYMSDIIKTNDITLDDENGDILDKNPVECIFKLLEIYGGELVRENFNIKWLQQRGTDQGILISYGKNIKGIEEDINLDEVITRIKPVGQDGLTLPEKFIDSPYLKDFVKIRAIEFGDCNSYEDLRIVAQDYYKNNQCDIPKANYKIDFIELSKTEEYKDYKVLERVYVGDTVTVRHKKLNIDLKCKVIRVRTNVLTDRIEEVELGNFKPSLNDSFSNIGNVIQNMGKEIVFNNSNLQKAVDNATKLLTNALGGYVLKKQDEILIMDTQDEKTATKVWRWNLNGLGYSGTGVNGPYRLAITMDGSICADFMTTGVLDGALIKAGTVKTGSLEVDAQQTINVKIPSMQGDIEGIKKANTSTSNAIATIQTQIIAIPGQIDSKVSASITTATNNAKGYTDSQVVPIIERVKTAEQKITPDAIVATVKDSITYYKDTLIPSATTLKVSRAGPVINPLNAYNFVDGTIVPNNTLVVLEGGRGEYTPVLEGLNIYGTKVVTFDKQVDRVQEAESKIEQTSNRISLVVREDGTIEGKNLVAAINISPTKIEMSALNLDLSGYVTFTNLSTPGQTTIDGGNLKTHSIGADKIKVEELFVGKGGIRMDNTASLTWEQLEGKPFIPRSASDIGALDNSYLNRLTRIDNNGIYTGTVDAGKVLGNTFYITDFMQFVKNGVPIMKLGSNLDGSSDTGSGQLFLNDHSSIDVNPMSSMDTIRLRANRTNYLRAASDGSLVMVCNGSEVKIIENGVLCGGGSSNVPTIIAKFG